MAIIPVLMSIALGAGMGANPPAGGLAAPSGQQADQTVSNDERGEQDAQQASSEDEAREEAGEASEEEDAKTRDEAAEASEKGNVETPAEAAGDKEAAQKFEAGRNAVEKRYQTGLTPAHVKGLWCGLQLGGVFGDFEGVATGDDFMYYAGSVTSFRLGFVAGLSDDVGLDVEMRVARTGAMFHNTTGIEAGVRVAPLGEGRRGVPLTLSARVGISALPGFMGTAWHEEAFSSENIIAPAALGSLRFDVRAPIAVQPDRVWYFLGETAFAYDFIERQIYHADLTTDVSRRPNVYSGEYLGGVGTGWAIPDKHLNVHVEVLGGVLSWPSGLGETGGMTGVGLLRIDLQGLSVDDLKRTGPHPSAPHPTAQ